MKTLQELIFILNARKINCLQIAQRIGHKFSAIYKVKRGEQDDLPYTIGKRIEQLEAKTRRMKK